MEEYGVGTGYLLCYAIFFVLVIPTPIDHPYLDSCPLAFLTVTF